MDATVLEDPVLARFRDGVVAAYGDRVERIVLFGSRARGDHREDSDYDVAVFLREMGDLWDELGTLARIGTDVFWATQGLISAKPFAAAEYHTDNPLMSEIRRDGWTL